MFCAHDCSTRVRSDLLDDGIPDTLVSVSLPPLLLRRDGRELVCSAVAYERQKQMAAAITNERTAAERTCPYPTAIRVGMFLFNRSHLTRELPPSRAESRVRKGRCDFLSEWAGSMSDSGPATGVLAADEKERPA